MVEVRTGHTADLDRATLEASRRLLVGVPLELAGGLTCDWRDGDPW